LDGPSGELDAVVELVSAAVGGCDDSAGPGLPEGGVHADGGWSGRIGEAHHVVLVVVLGDPLPVGNACGDLAVEHAVLLISNIRIVIVSFESSSTHNVLIGGWGVSTSASVVAGVAVDDLLHGEGGQGLAAESPHGFDVFGGGESPARTALFLVVDGGDDALRVPIVAGWIGNGSGVFGCHVFGGTVEIEMSGEVLHEEAFGEFFLGEIHEFRHTIARELGSAVEFGGNGKVLLEDVKAGLILALAV